MKYLLIVLSLFLQHWKLIQTYFGLSISTKNMELIFFLDESYDKNLRNFFNLIQVKKYCENKKYCNDNFNNLYRNHCYNYFPKLA